MTISTDNILLKVCYHHSKRQEPLSIDLYVSTTARKINSIMLAKTFDEFLRQVCLQNPSKFEFGIRTQIYRCERGGLLQQNHVAIGKAQGIIFCTINEHFEKVILPTGNDLETSLVLRYA